MVYNEMVGRAALMSQMGMLGDKDIDKECGYPTEISASEYDTMYRREGIAKRVNDIYPDECWSDDPTVSEKDDAEETEFDRQFKDIRDQFNLWEVLNRLDRMSGIGQYGVLVFGTSDAKDLTQPAEGVAQLWDPTHEGPIKSNGDNKLLYLRVYREAEVRMKDWEQNQNHPRYGWPTMYDIDMRSPTGGKGTVPVHWSRVLHVCDDRLSSEVFGSPRQESVFNRLLDIRKLLGGSAEMFWKGAFPGFAFETNPDITAGDTYDEEKMHVEFDKLAQGLRRYIAMAGVQTKSLAPQVADPEGHLMSQIKAVCIAKGIPLRKFIGAEAGQLASGEESRDWNRRIKHRQNRHVTPAIIRPTVNMMIALGILPSVAEPIHVGWPDLNAPSDKERNENAKLIVDAIGTYISKNLETVMGKREFLIDVMNFEPEQVDQFLESAEELLVQEDALLGPNDQFPPGTPPPPPVPRQRSNGQPQPSQLVR